MRRSHKSRGFTLVELMVSIAIALLLVLGVNAIFKSTAKAVGAGQSVLSAGRDARTFLRTLYWDLNPTSVDPVIGPNTSVGDPICFIIQSSHIYAFRNLSDQQGATDQTHPYTDTQLFQTGGPWFGTNSAPVPFVHTRSHRIDKLGFFSHGLFARQTSSNSVNLLSPTTSSEAWIVYEHAAQPNKLVINATNTTSWYAPGAPANSGNDNNDYNFFACDWLLARNSITLIPTLPTPPPYGQPVSADPIYLVDPQIASPGSSTLLTGLQPLSMNSVASATIGSESSAALPIYSSRLDIAQTSIQNFGLGSRPNGLASYGYSINAMGQRVANANNGADWWDPMIGGPTSAFPNGQRFQASPFILSPKNATLTSVKMTPFGLAKASPSLIRGCTQFIVEYAGNFYTKDPTKNDGSASMLLQDGSHNPQNIPTPDPSGQLDYYKNAAGQRCIRWYGYPRLVTMNTNGDPNYAAPSAGNVKIDTTYGKSTNAAIDAVIPLRDVLNVLTPAGVTPPSPWGQYADAERFSSNFPGVGSDYWQALVPATDQTTPYLYTAAWGPDSTQAFPKMIRIVICIDDHEGRIDHPQFYEYVFDVLQ